MKKRKQRYLITRNAEEKYSILGWRTMMGHQCGKQKRKG